MQLRLDSDLLYGRPDVNWSSCLYFLRAGIAGGGHSNRSSCGLPVPVPPVVSFIAEKFAYRLLHQKIFREGCNPTVYRKSL